MIFTTEVKIPLSAHKMNHQDRIMTLGSCFAESIGAKLCSAYFLTDVNPFGVQFNPISIANGLELLLGESEFSMKELFQHNELWKSFSHSSHFSDPNPEACLEKINDRLRYSRHFLQNANFLMITFGTAWVFESLKDGKVVSNCHKLPATEFVRRRLSVDEIVDRYKLLIPQLQALSPTLHIVFSVSPIRHLKDGLTENNLSKSTLLLAIDQIRKVTANVHYFPSYEIQLDELRDYRFYAADMLHPSEVAVNHIWNRFSECYFSDETLSLKKRLEQLSADLFHRPIHPDSKEFERFQSNLLQRKSSLMTDFPFLADRLI